MALLAGIAQFIVDVIAGLGYPGLVLMMALESMLAPVPSEVVMPFAGYLVWAGTFSMAGVLAASLVGSLLGSLASYYIGYYGGRPLVERYGRWFLIGPHELAWTDRFFARRGAYAVLLCRFIPAVRHVVSIPAGTARMPLGRFVLATALGAFAWNAILAYAGLSLGPRWEQFGEQLAPYEYVVLAALVLLGAALAVRAWRASKRPSA